MYSNTPGTNHCLPLYVDIKKEEYLCQKHAHRCIPFLFVTGGLSATATATTSKKLPYARKLFFFAKVWVHFRGWGFPEVSFEKGFVTYWKNFKVQRGFYFPTPRYHNTSCTKTTTKRYKTYHRNVKNSIYLKFYLISAIFHYMYIVYKP